jgi:hypothetical protein
MYTVSGIALAEVEDLTSANLLRQGINACVVEHHDDVFS